MRKREKFFGKPFWQFKLRIPAVCFLVLFFLIPLYPKFPLRGVEGSYVAVRVEDLVVLSALLVWGFWQGKNHFPVVKKKIFKLFLLYWLAGLVSLVSGMIAGDLVFPKIGLFHLLRRVEYMSLFFIAEDAFKVIKISEVAASISLVSLSVFAYGMGQRYFGLPVVSTMNEEFSKGILLRLDKWTRISSTFAGHYDLGAWLVMVLPLFPALIAVSKRKLSKFILVAIALVNFYLLILTASRVSFAAYLLGVTVVLLLLKSFRWLPPVLILSLLFGFRSQELSVRLASSLSFLPQRATRTEEVVSRVTPSPVPLPTPSLAKAREKTSPPPRPKKTIFREIRSWPKPEEIGAAAARSSNIRFNVEWPRALRAFLKNPLWGTGYSSLGLAVDNDYLRILGETGILGFLSFSLIIFHLARLFWNSLFKEKRLVLAGFLGALAGFLSNALFIDVFEASKDAFYFWLLMGGAYRISNKQNAA